MLPLDILLDFHNSVSTGLHFAIVLGGSKARSSGGHVRHAGGGAARRAPPPAAARLGGGVRPSPPFSPFTGLFGRRGGVALAAGEGKTDRSLISVAAWLTPLLPPAATAVGGGEGTPILDLPFGRRSPCPDDLLTSCMPAVCGGIMLLDGGRVLLDAAGSCVGGGVIEKAGGDLGCC
mmetsp:Transcript_29270/g.58912  ORF Transcript_29270/g.58912 Transcript_29270/m.58912 type:complete len:177 (+) Transcript_29270:75-605(+)